METSEEARPLMISRIGEKWLEWVDEPLSPEHILESITLYWLTETFPRSIYTYRQGGHFAAVEQPEALKSDLTKFVGHVWPGDEDEQARLEEQAATYDPEPFWAEIHPRLLSTIQHELSAPPPTLKIEAGEEDEDAASTSMSRPRDSRGPGESISAFTSRLAPSRTSFSDVGPWIWMWKPKSQVKEGDVATLVRKGNDLLQAYEEEASSLRAAHDKSGAKTTAGLTRKLNPLRRTLEQNIFALAKETGVTSGKWMFFPTVDYVDSFWKTVVTALDKGDLGEAAKVATDDGSGQARLICVYTKDFSDKEDVKRVLLTLVEKGLVDEESRPIYYKCDAYTHLDIKSNNAYGLKASLFSSRDILTGKV
ncbi:UPF0696 protein C11orf68 -like protein [Penicillium subrubescens]|uniref:UPF0696 protein C11orf68-like protein n=1 Tax=Penicillium subrubescens TaxID=1316194 RepID=A0A1Q5TBC2_9EURO|nr:UPF0696 protein C11orf68 -like protein [Penicillium subrubescens]